MPVCIRIRNQLGLSFQRTPENVSNRHGWFLSNFPPHKTNYSPFQVAILYKKQGKSIDTKFFSILAITRVDSQMLISQLCISSLWRFFSRKGTCNLSTTAWRKRIPAYRLHTKEANLWFSRVKSPNSWQSQISFFSRKIIFQVSHFAIYRPIWQPCPELTTNRNANWK